MKIRYESVRTMKSRMPHHLSLQQYLHGFRMPYANSLPFHKKMASVALKNPLPIVVCVLLLVLCLKLERDKIF